MSITKHKDGSGWKRGAGPYSDSDAGITDTSNRDKPVDRSAQINEVGSRNGGLAAPVSKGPGRGF